MIHPLPLWKKISLASMTIFAFILILWSLAWPSEMRTHEDDRIELTLSIARWYELTRDQTILLLAIEKHEAGTPAQKEFGIEGQPKIVDARERYCRNACKCAKLIKRFCPNTKLQTIQQFGHGFGTGKARYRGYSEDFNWWKKVIRHMKDYKNIFF